MSESSGYNAEERYFHLLNLENVEKFRERMRREEEAKKVAAAAQQGAELAPGPAGEEVEEFKKAA